MGTMEIKVEELSSVKRKLEVVVPKEKVDEEIETICQDLKKRVKVKGFRPGRVPIPILKRIYHQDVISQAMLKIIEKTYQKALDEAKLKPLFEPTISPEALEEGKAFKYAVTLEVMPDIKLGEYKGLEVEVPLVDIDEDTVNRELEKLRETHAEVGDIKEERPLKLGDYAILDFQGYIGETPIDNLKANDFMVELGGQQLHENIEKSLLGMKKGEEKVVKLKYPKDHQDPNLAGKEVELKIKVKDIREKILPELNDEFAKQVGDYENLDQLKEAVKRDIEQRVKAARDAYIKDKIISQLIKETEIEVPEGLVEQELHLMIDRASRFSSPHIKEHLDLEKMKKDLRPLAEEKVKMHLILGKIAELENIKPTKEELDENLSAVASQLKKSVESLRGSYAEERLRVHIIEEKTLKFLRDHAKIIEKNMKKKDDEK